MVRPTDTHVVTTGSPDWAFTADRFELAALEELAAGRAAGTQRGFEFLPPSSSSSFRLGGASQGSMFLEGSDQCEAGALVPAPHDRFQSSEM